jgi:NAD(P)-dependent dehydrogenase (short-subunit alcohol dehydrogenase family)
MKEFKGKCAVITGGASGIGLGYAKKLAADGAKIVIADIEGSKAEAAARDITASGGQAIGVACDVAKATETDRLVEIAKTRFGGAQLVCANAGVTAFKPLLDTTPEDWTWMLGINLLGMVNTVRSFLPSLIAMPGERHILVTASMVSLRPPPVPNMTQYTASKFGVLGFCYALEPELEPHNIGLTVMMPGPVVTDLSQGSTRRNPEHAPPVTFTDNRVMDGARFISAEDTAKIALDAVHANRPLITTHPSHWPQVESLHKRIKEAFTV